MASRQTLGFGAAARLRVFHTGLVSPIKGLAQIRQHRAERRPGFASGLFLLQARVELGCVSFICLTAVSMSDRFAAAILAPSSRSLSVASRQAFT